MTIEIHEDAPAAPIPSAISWGAILGGAVAAIAVTLILLTLGAGLGFAEASPWGDLGGTAARLGVFAGIWLIVTQWLSAAAGGYLTGRLRVRWTATHVHEVFFRDTAHGFLAWAVATAIIAAVAANGGALATNDAAQVTDPKTLAPNFSQDADALYRTPQRDPGALAAARSEAERLLAKSIVRGGLTAEEHDYLIAAVDSRTGVGAAEATRRVEAVMAAERQAADAARVAADKARKAAAAFAILTTLSMLIGAFIASVAAVLGGHQRDEHV